MRIKELLEAKQTIRDQIIADVRQHGGNASDYFVRFTDVDKLGFSARQSFGRSPDIDNPEFSIDYIGKQGRPALWFYPLSYYLKHSNIYSSEKPYVWLVKLKSNAWLQSATEKTKQIEPAPAGHERVGILRQSSVPAAIFFQPGFDIVGKYYDYAGQHQRHGQVKGAPNKLSWLNRIKGIK